MRKIIGVAATAAILVLTGCAQAPGSTTSNPTPKPVDYSIDKATDNKDFKEHEIRMSDGTTVTCLTWIDYDTYNKTKASGLWCKEDPQ